MMCVTEAMVAIFKTTIRFQAVVNQRSAKVRENIEVFHRLASAFAVDADPRQQRRYKRMHPMELRLHTHTCLIGMSNANAAQRIGNCINRRRKTFGDVYARLRYRSFRERKAEQVVHERRGPLYRKHVMLS